MRSVFVVLFAIVSLASCASGGAGGKRDKAPLPDYAEAPAGERAARDAHLEEVKKNAADQLQCPIEQVNVVCLRRDADGDCVMVRADGCDKSYEYDFGDN